MDENNSRNSRNNSRGFDAILNEKGKDAKADQKQNVIDQPKTAQHLKHLHLAEFISSNILQNEQTINQQVRKREQFSEEENSNSSLRRKGFSQHNTLTQNADRIQENNSEYNILSEGNMRIVDKQGYSNFPLNPSVNSGLEHDLIVNIDTIKHWYYTLGKSFRQYQFNIVKTCLSSNTLVALPTGLGKTFVAATVMLNFYLWFPKGKIFFLAPTRPLVNQQIECIRHLGIINPDDIFEMTGNYPIPKRKEMYNKCRIFFQTPQTLENDLAERRYEGQDLCLVVFDEAHRGTGNYAYVNIMKCFESLGRGYRVLALSATPGNEFDSIQDVLNNLCISKLEIKDEEDFEVKQYVHSKEILPIKIQLTTSITKILQLLANLLNVEFEFFKSKNLLPVQYYKIIKNPLDIGQGLHFSIRNLLIEKKQQIIEEQHISTLTEAYDNLTTLYQLLQGKKKISEQGVNNFKDWLFLFEAEKSNDKGKIIRSKKKILESQDFKDLWKLTCMDDYAVSQEVKKKYAKKNKISENQMRSGKDGGGQESDEDMIQNGSKENSRGFNESSSREQLGIGMKNKSNSSSSNEQNNIINDANDQLRDIETHPKSVKLVELLKEYFSDTKNISNESKTIVFTQGRNSASELNRLLNSAEYTDSSGQKMFRSEIFIGQANLDGNGMNQKQQIETIRLFKSHVYNILIATCIGEEGLDIGEVDLIICYDSGFSPIRMIQRMGRTGRKRAGKVYVLLMEGKEYASYTQSQKKHKELIQLLKNNSCRENLAGSEKKGRGRMAKVEKKQFVFYGFNPRMIPVDVNPTCRIVQSLDEGDINNSFDTGSIQSEEDQEMIDCKENTKGILRGNKFKENGDADILAEEEEEDEDDEEEQKERMYQKLIPQKQSSIMEIEKGEEIEMLKRQKTLTNEHSLGNNIIDIQEKEIQQNFNQRPSNTQSISTMEVEEEEGESFASNKLDISQATTKEKVVNVETLAVASIDQFEQLKKPVQPQEVEFFSLEQNPRKNTTNQGAIAPRTKGAFKDINEEDRKNAKRLEAEERVKELALCVNRKRQSLPRNTNTYQGMSNNTTKTPIVPSSRQTNYYSQSTISLFDSNKISRVSAGQHKPQDSVLQPLNNDIQKVQIKSIGRRDSEKKGGTVKDRNDEERNIQGRDNNQRSEFYSINEEEYNLKQQGKSQLFTSSQSSCSSSSQSAQIQLISSYSNANISQVYDSNNNQVLLTGNDNFDNSAKKNSLSSNNTSGKHTINSTSSSFREKLGRYCEQQQKELHGQLQNKGEESKQVIVVRKNPKLNAVDKFNGDVLILESPEKARESVNNSVKSTRISSEVSSVQIKQQTKSSQMSILNKIKGFQEDNDEDSEDSDDDDPEMIKKALNGLPISVAKNEVSMVQKIVNRKSQQFQETNIQKNGFPTIKNDKKQENKSSSSDSDSDSDIEALKKTYSNLSCQQFQGGQNIKMQLEQKPQQQQQKISQIGMEVEAKHAIQGISNDKNNNDSDKTDSDEDEDAMVYLKNLQLNSKNSNKLEVKNKDILGRDAKQNESMVLQSAGQIVNNFAGIKDIIEDKKAQLVTDQNQRLIVQQTQKNAADSLIQQKNLNGYSSSNNMNAIARVSNGINGRFQDSIQTSTNNAVNINAHSTNNMINNTNAIAKQVSSTSQHSSNYIAPNCSQSSSQTSSSSCVPEKKKAYQLINEKLKRDMESEFDQEEWDQRNKNKTIEQPKLDPKARSRLKKDNKKAGSKEDGIVRENSNSENPSISAGQQSQSSVVVNPVNADFKDIFTLIDQSSDKNSDEDDDDKDSDLGFIESLSKTFQKGQNSLKESVSIQEQQQQQYQINNKTSNTTFRKNNPYLYKDGDENNTSNAVNNNLFKQPWQQQFPGKRLFKKN